MCCTDKGVCVCWVCSRQSVCEWHLRICAVSMLFQVSIHPQTTSRPWRDSGSSLAWSKTPLRPSGLKHAHTHRHTHGCVYLVNPKLIGLICRMWGSIKVMKVWWWREGCKEGEGKGHLHQSYKFLSEFVCTKVKEVQTSYQTTTFCSVINWMLTFNILHEHEQTNASV